MNPIDLSICPTLACNMNCEFCYIRNHNSRLLDLEILADFLNMTNIRYLDVYGGEITILPTEYAAHLVEIVSPYRPNYVTNGLYLNEFWTETFKSSGVSFSMDSARDMQEEVKKNIRLYDSYGIPYSIITVDIAHPDYEFLTSLANLKSLSVKPYSPAAHLPDRKPMMLEILRELHDSYPVLFERFEMPARDRDACCHYFMMPDGKTYDVGYVSGKEEFFTVPYTEKVSDLCLTCEFYHRCFNEHYAGYSCLISSGECLGRKSSMLYMKDAGRL